MTASGAASDNVWFAFDVAKDYKFVTITTSIWMAYFGLILIWLT